MENKKIAITIRFFASAKDLVGTSGTTVELPGGSVAGDAVARILSKFPALKQLHSHMRIAVNEEYVDLTAQLHDRDELAFIPPVSGG